MRVKIATVFASPVFVAIGWEAATPFDRTLLQMLTGVAKLSTRQEFLYKSPEDLGDAFNGFPSFGNEVQHLKQALIQGPRKITKHMKRLDKLSAGISGIVVSG